MEATNPPPAPDASCAAASVEPVIRPAGKGYRWLATTPPDTAPRIGVIGLTSTEAHRRFHERYAYHSDLPSRTIDQ